MKYEENYLISLRKMQQTIHSVSVVVLTLARSVENVIVVSVNGDVSEFQELHQLRY